MQFDKLRYNIMLLVAVIMIVFIAGFYNYGSSPETVPDDDSGKDSSQIEQQIPPTPSTDLPTFKTWNKLWEYSSAIMEKGYTSESLYITEVSAPMGISLTQTLNISVKKNKTQALEETYSTSTDSRGVFSFKSRFLDEDKVYTRETKNYNFAEKTHTFTNEEIKVQTLQECENKNVQIPGTTALPISPANVTNVTFDKITNKTFYVIKFDYKLDCLPEMYYNNFYDSGQIEKVKMDSISFEIKIYKSNAHVFSITTVEKYDMVPTIMPAITTKSVATKTQKFTMVEDLEISRGY